MDVAIAVSTFVLLFVAELGDKTQLAVMMLAHRYPISPVIVGTFSAFLLLNILAVVVGESVFRYVPQSLILLAAGLLFIVFALLSWKHANSNEQQSDLSTKSYNAIWASFTLIFVAELGDKTQLAMVTMAASTGSTWSVLLGGTLALWSVAILAIALGNTVLRRVPARWMHRIAAGLFLAFGVAAITKSLLDMSNQGKVI
ncbi:TMEM165/GDT1 family protein [Kaarinaea lacus]